MSLGLCFFLLIQKLMQSSPQRKLVFLEGVFSVQNPKLPVDIGWLWSSEENIGGLTKASNKSPESN